MLLLSGFLPVVTASAQEAPPTASAEDVEALRQRVRLLEQQVDSLANPEVSAPSEEFDLTTQVNGYASVELAYDGEVPIPAFRLDELLLTYQANLGRQYGFYSEIAYEPEEMATAIDLESIEVRWRPSEKFNLRFGRFHTPLSYWSNTAFHGSFRFTPVHRPNLLALEEDGAAPLPVHQVGAMAYGSTFAGFWQISYHASVTNGRSTAIGGIAQNTNLSGLPAASVGVDLTSPGGLTLGVAGYTHTLTPPSSELEAVEEAEGAVRYDEKWSEHIATGHLILDGSSITVLAEGMFFAHVDADGALHPNFGGYAVISAPMGKTTPYLRGEYSTAPDANDPLFAPVGGASAFAMAGLGVRQDLGLRVALKAEGMGINHDDEGWHPEAFVQLATMF